MIGTRFGVIDLGSNSIRLVLYQRERAGRYTEILNISKTARLSSHLDEYQEITSAGIQMI